MAFIFSPVFVGVIQIMKSRSWATHEAFVYETKVEERWKYSRFEASRKVYWCSVSYLFQVRDLSFIGKTQDFENKEHQKIELADQDCEKVPKNSNIQIKFDPDDPNWSCQSCNLPVQYPILVIFCICNIGIGLYMFFSASNVYWPEPEKWI